MTSRDSRSENGRLGRVAGSPETVDRILVIVCAAVWLVALGLGVAAAVALVDLGSDHPVNQVKSDEADTPWLLYVVIGVSALVILAAIPLLLRARRTAAEEPVPQPVRPRARLAVDRDPPDYPGPTPARYSAKVISAVSLDRMWLRCGTGVLIATGAAMIAVATATYLMAGETEKAAWAAYIVAAVITVGMIAIPVLYLRQLRAQLAADSD